MTVPTREFADVSLAVEKAWSAAKDVEEATQNLWDMMKADDVLYRAVLRPYEQNAARATVNQRKLTHRAVIWNKEHKPSQPVLAEHPAHDWSTGQKARQARAMERKSSLINVMQKTLLDMPLARGVKLGEGTHDDVKLSYVWAERQAKGNAAKMYFYGCVLERLKDNAVKVKDVWTLDELEGIRTQAKENTDGEICEDLLT